MCKYMLDTNVLMHNPSFAMEQDREFYVPMVVVEELGSLAHEKYSTGYFAREANRIVEYLIKEGRIHLVPTAKENIEKRFEDVQLHDNLIINTALAGNYTLVTDDTNMRIKCNLIGVDTQPSRDTISVNDVLNSYEHLKLSNEEAAHLYEKNSLVVEDEKYTYGLATIGDSEEPFLHCGHTIRIVKQKRKSKKYSSAKYIKSKNPEQLFLLDALDDKNVKLITAIGAAGTGKTLLTLYSALEQVISGAFDRIYVIVNPVHVGGKDKIGFLPGELDSKLSPYIQALYDNLEVIYGKDVPGELSNLFDSEFVQIVALDYLRGRTLHNGFIIVDEAQNYNQGEIKTVVTRVGETSKIVLLGDIEQIDARVSPDTTGIFVTASKFTDKQYARNIVLNKSERSQLARDATKLL